MNVKTNKGKQTTNELVEIVEKDTADLSVLNATWLNTFFNSILLKWD